MRNIIGILFLLYSFNNFAYAAIENETDTGSVGQGVAHYDWQTCVNNAVGECLNGCQFSHDPQCGNKCHQTAEDKCKEAGLSPPS